MKSNFKIYNFVEVEIDGRTLDLHNNFDFVSFYHNAITNELNIYFDKSSGDWVPLNEFKKLTFTLTNISYLNTIDPNQELLSDDTCIVGITFYYHNDREENFGLLDRVLPGSEDDIIFTFESERVIRANCESVILEME